MRHRHRGARGLVRLSSMTVALALASLLSPPFAAPQAPPRTARIGYLGGGSPSSTPSTAFVEGLRTLGWVAGRNLAVDYGWAEGSPDRMVGLSRELTRRKPEVIVVNSAVDIRTAAYLTGTIPVVTVMLRPLTDTLARPVGNITGVSLMSPDLDGKRLQFLRELVPGASRVGVLIRRGQLWVSELQAGATALGLGLTVAGVTEPDEFAEAIAGMARQRLAAVVMAPHDLFVHHRELLADLAAKNRLPLVCGFRQCVEAGGLLSYGPSEADLQQRLATLVDRILRGARPGDLPVEQPTRFELAINLRTAKTLGLTVPSSLLVRADHVIE